MLTMTKANRERTSGGGAGRARGRRQYPGMQNGTREEGGVAGGGGDGGDKSNMSLLVCAVPVLMVRCRAGYKSVAQDRAVFGSAAQTANTR